ncbi:conserved hypothetical protein [metagenome]|uniref:ROK family protein n=1 Tax=metagenome TaxID=256318 RepID=A0A2P2CDD2_9ZZZZ
MSHGHPMITLTRGRFGTPASRVMEEVRAAGPVARDAVAHATGLSLPTVNRTVSALVRSGLLRERRDAARVGVNGRPGVPVEVDPSRFATLGFHLGRGVASVAVGDLRGRVICHRTVAQPVDQLPDLEELARLSAQLLGTQPGRAPLVAGLVAPWVDLGLDRDATRDRLHDVVGLDVVAADHVAAVAATEFLHRRHGTGGVTLYVYARNTVGLAIAVDRGSHTEVSRTGSLTHFPTGSEEPCTCGRTGCLAATYSDLAVARRAAAVGVVPPGADVDAVVAAARAGSDAAHTLLTDRARNLGRVAAVMRDMAGPDRVVLVGQAFTDYQPALPVAVEAFEGQTALGDVDVSFTRFGAGIQATTACTVAIGPVYDDPFGLLPSAPAHPPRTSTGSSATKGKIA